jgi:hypothetical protein
LNSETKIAVLALCFILGVVLMVMMELLEEIAYLTASDAVIIRYIQQESKNDGRC